MHIRIIKEKQFEPTPIQYPPINPDFFNIRQATTNKENPRQQRLKIFMHEKVHNLIWQHARLDMVNELGGALLGYYAQHKEQQFLLITNVLNQPPQYFASPQLIKFTTLFYSDLENYLQQINAIYPQIIRLGLYHTHPNYGIFMSKTDISSFKRTKNENHAIAHIVDPIQDEDGIFYWLNEYPDAEKDISAAAPYQLYSTHNPAYAPHNATHNSSILQRYNSFLIEKNPSLTLHPKQDTLLDSTINNPESTKQKITIKIDPETGMSQVNTPSVKPSLSAHISVKDITVKPMTCPLYNLQYTNSELSLNQYRRSLKNRYQHGYPYKIFVPHTVKQIAEKALKQSDTFMGMLHGTLGFDSLKELYFLYITSITDYSDLFSNQPKQNPEILASMVKKVQASNNDVVGWVTVNNNKDLMPYEYYEVHQNMFTQSHCLGILLKSDANHTPDFENMILVAYDHEQREPYAFYRHFFFYKQPLQ